jgi:AcrR family transcriptional regulator
VARQARLGRPPDTDSAVTRARIIEVARSLFATRGYEATSNRLIAEEAGLTTGAIYHYFDRKLDIYVAVYEETQRGTQARFAAGTEGLTTFIAHLRAVLETAHELNNEDPSLARFLGSCRVDASRDPAIAEAIRSAGVVRGQEFFAPMIELGIRTGEIDRKDAGRMVALLDTLMIGLIDAVSNDRDRHRRAIDGIIALAEGRLIAPS